MPGDPPVIGFYGGLTASLVILTLLMGAGSHAASPAALGDALWAHGVLGPRLRRSAAVGLPVAEGVLGWPARPRSLRGTSGGCRPCSLRGPPSSGSTPPTRGTSSLSAEGAVRLFRPGCAPEPLGDPAGRGPRRARDERRRRRRGRPVRLSTAELITLVLAAPACATLLWYLPAAMHEPTTASVHLPTRATAHQQDKTTVHRTAEGVPTRWTSPPAP